MWARVLVIIPLPLPVVIKRATGLHSNGDRVSCSMGERISMFSTLATQDVQGNVV